MTAEGGITDDDVKALQAALGDAWLAGTGTYPEGRRLIAQPWPPRPGGRIVIGETAAEVLAGVREREAERARIRSEHVSGQGGHVLCPACSRCSKCDPHGPHSISGPY